MYRSYVRKIEYDEQPKYDESYDEIEIRYKHHLTGPLAENLEERFYKHGIRPEWLIIHRIIAHCVIPKSNKTKYLVKWRDLGYDQCTWEPENSDIAGKYLSFLTISMV